MASDRADGRRGQLSTKKITRCTVGTVAADAAGPTASPITAAATAGGASSSKGGGYG